MPLFNIFVDEKLAARQAQLDGQWKSLRAVINGCDDFPSSSWVEFVNDQKGWESFFDSGSDWSDNSKAATDEWQSKLQVHSQRVEQAGCRGSIGSVGGVDFFSPTGVTGIPGVKDPPPDDPAFIDTALDAFSKTRDAVLSPFATVGWVTVGLVVVAIVAIVWILTKGKGKAGPSGVSVGGA